MFDEALGAHPVTSQRVTLLLIKNKLLIGCSNYPLQIRPDKLLWLQITAGQMFGGTTMGWWQIGAHHVNIKETRQLRVFPWHTCVAKSRWHWQRHNRGRCRFAKRTFPV